MVYRANASSYGPSHSNAIAQPSAKSANPAMRTRTAMTRDKYENTDFP